MYKKILVPLDSSDLEKKGLKRAEELAKTYGAEIILLRIVPLVCFFAPPELVTPFIINEKAKEAAEIDLSKVAEEMKIRGYKVTAMVRTSQKVAVEIINFAKEFRVDLIVMCGHGRSEGTRWALGSVAHRVLTRLETPILLIHLNE